MLGVNAQAYMPLGDLLLEQAGVENCTAYERELDLDSGIARVTYQNEQGAFTREVFISAPDKVGVVHLTSAVPGGLHLELALSSQLKHTVSSETEQQLVLHGRCPSHIADNYHQDHPVAVRYEEGLGIAFELHLQVQVTGEEASIIRMASLSYPALIVYFCCLRPARTMKRCGPEQAIRKPGRLRIPQLLSALRICVQAG